MNIVYENQEDANMAFNRIVAFELISTKNNMPVEDVLDEFDKFTYKCIASGLHHRVQNMINGAIKYILHLSDYMDMSKKFCVNINGKNTRQLLLEDRLNNYLLNQLYPISECVWNNQ